VYDDPSIWHRLTCRLTRKQVFWVTLDNFLRYFDSIQRTRLFDETWTLTQQWTSVKVPAGAVTYLGTSFQINLSHPGPIVIVLAQPDVSYFQGLQGRYTYCLHFRIYNAKDTTKYLARSMHVSSGNFINTRSVSIDLDLEAGNYNISIKIEPSRAPYRTAESVIETEAPYRKQKLLQIGRNFELAHAKGKLREKEQEARKQKKEEARRESRERQAKMRKRRHEAKAREKRRKGRIAKEKMARERSDLLRRAGYVPAPPPLPEPGIPPVIINLDSIKVTGCIDVFDNDPNAELDDDDFEWDSSMDGDIYSSSSEDEKDYYADDPWNALLVLGLRVYSQSSAVTIKIREGDETDDDEPTPAVSLAGIDNSIENKDSKAEEQGQKSEKVHAGAEAQLSKLDTAVDQDIAKQPSASSETTLTPSEDDKSNNTTTEPPREHNNNLTLKNTNFTTPEQKN
jgi:hypothetical protein